MSLRFAYSGRNSKIANGCEAIPFLQPLAKHIYESQVLMQISQALWTSNPLGSLGLGQVCPLPHIWRWCGILQRLGLIWAVLTLLKIRLAMHTKKNRNSKSSHWWLRSEIPARWIRDFCSLPAHALRMGLGRNMYAYSPQRTSLGSPA